MRTANHGGGTEKEAFATKLEALKQKGSSVLIVGTDHEAHTAACRQLLGEQGTDRYRILVVTEEACCSEDCLDDSWRRSSRTRIITRSATKSTPVEADDSQSIVSSDLLSPLGVAVADAVASLQAEANGFEPAQLRLCVDSIAPLLVNHDPKSVFRLLHVLTTRVKQVQGMGQYHLPVDRDHDAARLLEPLFDAVVEVRSQDDRTEQRWHLRDQGTSSEWIVLTESS